MPVAVAEADQRTLAASPAQAVLAVAVTEAQMRQITLALLVQLARVVAAGEQLVAAALVDGLAQVVQAVPA
jgi:hypothetical protein